MIILLLDKLKRYETRAINQSLTTLSLDGWAFSRWVSAEYRETISQLISRAPFWKKDKDFSYLPRNLPPDRDRQEAAYDKGFLVEASFFLALDIKLVRFF